MDLKPFCILLSTSFTMFWCVQDALSESKENMFSVEQINQGSNEPFIFKYLYISGKGIHVPRSKIMSISSYGKNIYQIFNQQP